MGNYRFAARDGVALPCNETGSWTLIPLDAPGLAFDTLVRGVGACMDALRPEEPVMSELTSTIGFAGRLYRDKTAVAYSGYVKRDPLARLSCARDAPTHTRCTSNCARGGR
jgi:hypothetical protein